MTANEIADCLDGKIEVSGSYTQNIKEFYAGDFLSRVMGKAPEGCGWFTIMNNVNVAGVAVLAEVAAIVLCEGVTADDNLLSKCQAEGVWLITTNYSVYDCCKKVSA